jgi:hypothetical protein
MTAIPVFAVNHFVYPREMETERSTNERRSLACEPPDSRINLTAEGAIDLLSGC